MTHSPAARRPASTSADHGRERDPDGGRLLDREVRRAAGHALHREHDLFGVRAVARDVQVPSGAPHLRAEPLRRPFDHAAGKVAPQDARQACAALDRVLERNPAIGDMPRFPMHSKRRGGAGRPWTRSHARELLQRADPLPSSSRLKVATSISIAARGPLHGSISQRRTLPLPAGGEISAPSSVAISRSMRKRYWRWSRSRGSYSR
jgi:hypothetical protein